MPVMIYNPAHPKDKAYARPLTKEQVELVEPYIVGCMNEQKRMSEPHILEMLRKAGKPVVFDDPA